MKNEKTYIVVPIDKFDKTTTSHTYGGSDQHTLVISYNTNGQLIASENENGIKGQLRSVDRISPQVLVLSSYCFYDCENLEYVNFEDTQITSFEDFCFGGCCKLESLYLPESLKIIGDKCFSDCTELQVCDIPDALYTGNYLFQNCGKLKELLTKCSILENISQNAFKNSSIETFTFSNISSSEILNSSYVLKTRFFGIGHDCIIIPSDGVKLKYYNSTNQMYEYGVDVTVSFDKGEQSATGTMSSITVGFDQSWECPECLYKMSGKRFECFKDSSGNSYTPGSKYSFPFQNLTLYAQWVECKKVYVMLESCWDSYPSDPLEGDKHTPKIMYNLIKKQYSSEDFKNNVKVVFLQSEGSDVVKGYTNIAPTKSNIKKYMADGLNGDYDLAIFYFADHGAPLGVQNGEMNASDFTSVIKKGHPDTRIFFIMDCCHALSLAPSGFSKSTSVQSAFSTPLQSTACDERECGDDLMDQIFQEFENYNNASKEDKISFASSNLNTNPKLLGWYYCSKSGLGWSSYDMSEFVRKIQEKFSKGSTYQQVFNKIASLPYWYCYGYVRRLFSTVIYEDYFGYSKDKPDVKASDGISKTDKEKVLHSNKHRKKNHNGNFDESVKIFT